LQKYQINIPASKLPAIPRISGECEKGPFSTQIRARASPGYDSRYPRNSRRLHVGK
jgi:hypothetical protein